jgi:succinate-semialdehyde dehydrogenase/glutarate-semialdehyde dehydrogenase
MSLALNDPDLFRLRAYIDGEWVTAESGERYDVTNPATGAVLASVPFCGRAETVRAIAAAARAQKDWRRRPVKERAAILRAWHGLILQHQDDLAAILTAEQGKPLAEARGEIVYGANYVEWFAEEAKRIDGDIVATTGDDKRALVIKQPVGVVACITPWNFPNAMLTRKIAPALAAGCSVVCKPANETPLSAFALAELAERAGVPAGVINILNGATQDIGAELTSNPAIRKLTFTGSTAVGRKLLAACAPTIKRTSMELGGNAPFIVFDDADIDAAIAGAMASKYRNAGQTCVCSNRILVHAPIYDAFVERLTEAVKRLTIGPGEQQGVTIGPLITEAAVAKVMSLIDDSVCRGAKVLIGGGRSALGAQFVEPTVLADITRDMPIFREEIFGPVAPLMKFETEEDAIALANDSEYGLAAYVYTRDIGRAWRMGEALEYGIVGLNEGLTSNEMAPFGGMKQSGHGREGSKYGIDDYLEIKYLCMGGLDR